jgi:two-component system LytT family sensor kinase
LRALEAQINPHFLFNCLNSIRALVAENPARAQDMITRLANIFRYNLHREPAHTVPLSSEVEVVGDYLALESVRFEDRLRVKFAISADAGQTKVPSMLLQALVENALKHGIASQLSGGDIVIRADRGPDATRIEVENSGQLGKPDAPEPGGVGLNNTRERLRILYGGRASLELRNRDGGRVVATVLIPARA